MQAVLSLINIAVLNYCLKYLVSKSGKNTKNFKILKTSRKIIKFWNERKVMEF